MPYRNIYPSLVAVLLNVGSSTFAFGQESGVPSGAETSANLLPSENMLREGSLTKAGQYDEATFWFYAGQLRWRSRFNASPDQNPTGEPTLFPSLLQTLGRTVNGWAFGDIPRLQQTIDAVLDWDERNPDPALNPAVHERMRTGPKDLRD